MKTTTQKIMLHTSVAIDWALSEKISHYSNLVLKCIPKKHVTVYIPDVFFCEIANTLFNSKVHGVMSHKSLITFMKFIQNLNFITIKSPFKERILSLAYKHTITYYESLFLDTSMATGCLLATTDEALMEAAAKQSVFMTLENLIELTSN